jgi:hypothetical protein
MGPGQTLGVGTGGALVPPRTAVVDGGIGGVSGLTLRYAPPSAPAYLAVKVGPLGIPVSQFGGLVFPTPPDFLLPLSVPASAPLVLPFIWLPSTPINTQVQGQWAVLDPATAMGVSLSNAYMITRP